MLPLGTTVAETNSHPAMLPQQAADEETAEISPEQSAVASNSRANVRLTEAQSAFEKRDE
jgi:hypothetical protein